MSATSSNTSAKRWSSTSEKKTYLPYHSLPAPNQGNLRQKRNAPGTNTITGRNRAPQRHGQAQRAKAKTFKTPVRRARQKIPLAERVAARSRRRNRAPEKRGRGMEGKVRHATSRELRFEDEIQGGWDELQ